MKQLSLRERFIEAKMEISPAQEFINEISKISHRKEATVRRWLYGVSEPDEFIKATLAEHYGTSIEVLFPKA